MRSLTRLGTVVETTSEFLRELAILYTGLHKGVEAELVRCYVAREVEGCFANTTPSESKRRIPEAGADLWCLMKTLESTLAANQNRFTIVCRVMNEQLEVTGVPSSINDDNDRVRVKEPMLNPARQRSQSIGSGLQLQQAPRARLSDAGHENLS